MRRTKTNWKTTDKRFVAFFDILGFKDNVMRNSHENIYRQLSLISETKEIIDNLPNNKVMRLEFGDVETRIVNFSDSIILFSKNDSIANFKYFLLAANFFFLKAIENKIPLKGGFAHGKISINKSKQIYFGQAIIDAFVIEEDVNYFGVTAHNSIDNYINSNISDLELSYLHNALFEEKTYLKSGYTEHLNINWFRMAIPTSKTMQTTKIENNYTYLKSIINEFKNTASGSPRKYIDNTLDVLDKIKNSLRK